MGSFSATIGATGDVSGLFLLRPADKATYSLIVLATESFVGIVHFQKTLDGGQNFTNIATYTGTAGVPLTGTVVDSTYENQDPQDIHIRFFCELLDTGESSDDINYTVADTEQTVKDIALVDGQFVTKDGKILMQFKEDSVDFPNNVTQSEGAGVLNGSTVTVSESGDGALHKTVLTLASTPLEVISVTTGAGVGGIKVYDLPEGYAHIHGCTADLSIAVETEADFTDGTPEGDFGIGTVAPANADALGTDATDDNIATATAFTMTAYAATVDLPPEASLNIDGTSTAVDVYVNALVDAADIDDSTTTNLLVSGTITLLWSNLGDY